MKDYVLSFVLFKDNYIIIWIFCLYFFFKYVYDECKICNIIMCIELIYIEIFE